ALAPGAATPAAALELTEQGFYVIRGSGRDPGPTIVAASNVNLAESNMDRMDPKELVAAVTGTGPSGATSGQDVLPDEAQELAQRVWWYLLFAGILLLIAETVLAHRYSRVRTWGHEQAFFGTCGTLGTLGTGIISQWVR